MSTYYEKLKDPRWQRKRLEVLNRDNFTCRDCGATEKTLHVHHCHYGRGAPWDTDLALLLTLCNGCHKERQEVEDSIRVFNGRLFALSPIKALKKLERKFSAAFKFGHELKLTLFRRR